MDSQREKGRELSKAWVSYCPSFAHHSSTQNMHWYGTCYSSSKVYLGHLVLF